MISKVKDKIKESPILIIKLALGIAFVLHGISKIIDIEGGIAMFSNIGLPGFVYVIVAIAELLAGLGILFNKYVKYSAYTIAVIMLGAIFLVKIKSGYLGGYELDIAYLAMALFIALREYCDCSDKDCKAEGHDHSDEKEQKEEA